MRILESTRGSETLPAYPGTPRWVKAFGVTVVVLILLLIIMLSAGRGDHGPRRHMSVDDPDRTPSMAHERHQT